MTTFPEPLQLAKNTPKSILCKDPIAFFCWGKPRICLLEKLTTLTYEGQESSLEPIWVTMGPSLMLFQVSSLSMLCMDPYYRTQVQLKWAFAEGSSNFVLIPAATSHLSSRFSTLMAVCIWTNYGKTKGLSRHTLLQHALFFACWDRWVFWSSSRKNGVPSGIVSGHAWRPTDMLVMSSWSLIDLLVLEGELIDFNCLSKKILYTDLRTLLSMLAYYSRMPHYDKRIYHYLRNAGCKLCH